MKVTIDITPEDAKVMYELYENMDSEDYKIIRERQLRITNRAEMKKKLAEIISEHKTYKPAPLFTVSEGDNKAKAVEFNKEWGLPRKARFVAELDGEELTAREMLKRIYIYDPELEAVDAKNITHLASYFATNRDNKNRWFDRRMDEAISEYKYRLRKD